MQISRSAASASTRRSSLTSASASSNVTFPRPRRASSSRNIVLINPIGVGMRRVPSMIAARASTCGTNRADAKAGELSMPPAKNADLHGFAPDACPVALLLIDWINDLEFQGGRRLLAPAVRAAARVAALKARARDAGIPVIYANDNFG